VAKELVANAEALIWLVGADVNGTLPRTDIQFLKNVLGKSKKPVYFVLNKADVKPEADIVKIIKEFSQVLEREKIAYIGISAYDSLEGKGLLYYKEKGCRHEKIMTASKTIHIKHPIHMCTVLARI